MTEENRMTEENKKTIIAFIAGLLVGGLLVFIFIEPSSSVVVDDNNDEAPEEVIDNEADNEDSSDEAAEREDEDTSSDTGGGSVSVDDQAAGSQVHFSDADFPATEGWVGVREYQNGQLTGLLGAVRWDKTAGLMPDSVSLLRPTVPGRTYAIVFYTENGDGVFSLANDRQMQGVMETFEAK